MLLPKPFQHEWCVVGTSIVDKHESDVFRSIEKIAERLRLKSLSFVEARHNDDDVARSRFVA
jgi:hypothetical protein